MPAIINRERSFSAPAVDTDLPPPSFAVPPVVFPSGTYACSPVAAVPQLTDIEQRLLRGMTVSLATDQQTEVDDDSGNDGWNATAPSQDCDCWLGYDNEDGFIFCVWNYSTGELWEVCMRFVTQLHVSSASEGDSGSGEVLMLTCSLADEPEPDQLPTPPNSSRVLAIRFLLRESAAPSADSFSLEELRATLEKAKDMHPFGALKAATTLAPSADSDTASSGNGTAATTGTTRNYTKQKKRSSVYATSSKRVSLVHHGSSLSSPGSGSSESGSSETFGGVSSLIEKFSSTSSLGDSHDGGKSGGRAGLSRGSGALATKAQFGSVRNIFGGMEEVDEEVEDEENEDQDL